MIKRNKRTYTKENPIPPHIPPRFLTLVLIDGNNAQYFFI